MNLYLRLILTLIKIRFAQKIDILEESRLEFRAWPWDCDINFHMTNSRYLALADLGRIFQLGQAGLLWKMLRRKWFPVIQAQDFSFFRPIDPLKRFTLTTKLIYWDEKYWYAEHRFLVENELCAILQTRGVIVRGRQKVPLDKVLSMLGTEVSAPPKPDVIRYWQTMIDAKKNLTK